MNMVVRARGYGPSTPLHDQSLPGTGTMPADRKVNRRDAEEPSLKEREGNRVYCLSLPGGSYEAEADQASGLMHIYRVTDHGERDASLEPEERRGEEERDLAMGQSLLPLPAGAGRGRDDGPTEWQRLQAHKQRLNEHYGKYRNWIRERSA
jgi:hypothetical protein